MIYTLARDEMHGFAVMIYSPQGADDMHGFAVIKKK